VILRGVVAPIAAAFALCLALLWYASARPVPRMPASRAVRTLADLRTVLRCLAVTAIGGYAALLGIVFVLGVLVVGDRDALLSAAWSSLFLLAIATPVFIALSWAFGRRDG